MGESPEAIGYADDMAGQFPSLGGMGQIALIIKYGDRGTARGISGGTDGRPGKGLPADRHRFKKNILINGQKP